ncbi:protein transporter yif1 [Artomyces pyxidatus]|uniref:Protein transporter yif1 n=1 Tax=Artomyces pyxidatus TaxID=48021 RepID=A0ACB8SJM6_9AGAM|nr:protein transporter yif1 [Artomyces pyxidatus]
MANYYSSRSPPPLQHPVPTHPAFIPEPPSTPVSPQGYQRYTSSPPVQNQQQHQSFHPAAAAGYPQFQPQPSHLHVQQGIPPQAHGVPDFSAWGIDGATAQFGMQLGQNAVAAGQSYVSKNLGGLLPTSHLKHHFNVSNSYVMRKLRLVVFPWRHRPWTRKMRRSETGVGEFQPPREDINAPDLYIPVMAFVTYILLAALHSGLQDRFHPEIFGIMATKAIVVLIFDFCFVKGGCYLLGVQGSAPVVDLLAYGGYKFVGVIAALVFGLLNPSRSLYLIAFFYVFFANAFFLLRSLRSVVLPDPSAAPAAVGTVSHAQRSRRITFLFLVAVVQVLFMGYLVRV